MAKPVKKVLSVHAGAQHVSQIVEALNDRGMLYKHATSIHGADNRLIGMLASISPAFHAGLKRREINALSDETQIETSPFFELIEIAARKIVGNTHFTTSVLPRIRDELFSKSISRKLAHESRNIDAVIGFPNCTLEIFQKIKYGNENADLYIEQPIGHYQQAEKILIEERELHPAFADSITFAHHTNRFKSRVDTELNLAKKIFCGSNFVRQTLIDSGFDEAKLFVNNYGSHFPPIEKIVVNQKKYFEIIFVGQISQRKGIKYLLDAVKSLKKNGIKLKLTLVGKIYGSGAWKNEYAGVVDQYYDHCDREKLRSIMECSDVFVLPSLFEGSALVVYEALALGLPCIVSSNTGADFIRDGYNGYTVPIRSAASIQERLAILASNPDQLIAMKENALATAGGLSWKRYHNRLIDLIS